MCAQVYSDCCATVCISAKSPHLLQRIQTINTLQFFVYTQWLHPCTAATVVRSSPPTDCWIGDLLAMEQEQPYQNWTLPGWVPEIIYLHTGSMGFCA